MFRSLRTRNYRLYAIGSLGSNTGTWMQRIAQDWLVLQLSDNSPIALGMVTFLQFSPTLVFGLLGGLIADRYDKRTILRCTQTVVLLAAAILGVLDITGVVVLWHVFVLAATLGVANAIEAPARQAFASELVGPDNLVNAVGLNSASFNAARLIGPAISGLMIGWIGTGPVFIINAVSSVLIIVLLTMIDPTKLYRSAPLARARGQLRESFRYIRTRSDLMLTIALVSMVSLFGLNLQVTIPLAATTIFKQGASQYGLLASALALGTLAGALIGAHRTTRPRARSLVLAAFGFGVAEIGLAFIGNYWFFAAMLIPTGMVSLYFMISANATVQLSADPQMRGRVMAVYMLFLMGTGAFGSPLVGWIADTWSVQWSIAIGGIAVVIASTVIGWLMTKRAGGVRVETHLHSSPHLEIHLGEERLIPQPAVALQKAS